MPKKTQAALDRQEYREELLILNNFGEYNSTNPIEELDLEDDYYYQD